MEIAVIGGGSIGLLFSYYLGRKNRVTVYTRTEGQSEAIRANGIHLLKKGCDFRAGVNAAPLEKWTGREELTILAVKQYQLQSVLNSVAERMPGDASLMFLQNGMGHVKWLSELPVKNIYIGSVEHGAMAIGDHSVSHNGIGVTRVAVYKGEAGPIKHFTEMELVDFPVEMADDFRSVLIGKLVVNAVINPLTAAFQVRNGELLDNPFFYEIFKDLFSEVAMALRLEDKEKHFANIVSVCRKTSANSSSMLKDIEAGRQTEIDGILGYILEEAEGQNIDTPIIRTYFRHIKGKEFQRGASI
ncbi:2-dehydropantoate 2-reductase [Mesobacillus zeae]|uniref:2-dehydropantoate 2-reductase n=1 Tax=Mesobacillus zeae TaxID=1917180 RepID=A0A398BCJ5_9BACI|nr:2-dehydropantoate 2-reductase [Mesobacillus zeae]RID87899.1 2-dehydropantoate 2-reductase [Mesobacillus zeae]